MPGSDRIDSLQSATIVFAAVFTSIFITIGIIWLLKYFFCNYNGDIDHENFDMAHFGNYRFGYDPSIMFGNSNNDSTDGEHPVVPFSTKFRLIFLEKALQHEIFHPAKMSSDIEKGAGKDITTDKGIIIAMESVDSTKDQALSTKTETDGVTDRSGVTDIPTVFQMDAEDSLENVQPQSDVNVSLNSNCITDDSIHTALSNGDDDNSSSNIATAQHCAICYDELLDGDEITTSNCNKTFHRTCIIEWLMQHDTCPYCRNTFKNIDTAVAFANDDEDDDASNNIDCEE